MLRKHFLNIISCGSKKYRLLFFSSEISSLKVCRKHLFYSQLASTDPSVLPHPENSSISDLYYLKYLVERNEYYNSVFDNNNIDLKPRNNSELINLLWDFINSPEKNLNFNDKMLEHFSQELSNAGAEEICKVAALFSDQKFANLNNASVHKLLRCFDKQISTKNFSTDETLTILFALKCAHINRLKHHFYFSNKAFVKFCHKINNLTPKQVVQFFFCITHQNFRFTEFKYNVRAYLNNSIPQYNSYELGIISKGMSKIKFNFGGEKHVNLSSNFINKILDDIENIDSVPLIDICKVIRQNLKPKNVPELLDLQAKIVSQLARFNRFVLLNVALTGLKYKCIDSTLWDNVVRRFQENLTNIKFDDFQKLLQIMTSCNIQDEKFLTTLSKEYETREITEGNYRYFISFLINLSHQRMYPKNLINLAFSEEFVTDFQQRKFFKSAKVLWWILYCNIELEKPEYLNNFLEEKDRARIYRICKYTVASDQNIDAVKFYSVLTKVRDVLKNLYGEESVFRSNCLPHYEDGLVMKFDKNLKAQPIPEEFKDSKKGYAIKPLDNDHFWIFLIVLPIEEYLWESDTLTLSRQTQHRLLQNLGYIPIMVNSKLLKQYTKQVSCDSFLSDVIKQILEDVLEKKINETKLLS